MLLSPPPLRFNVECFYSIVNHQIQRVRNAVNISSIWCFLPHKSLDPVAYRGLLAPGAKMGIGAPPFSVSDWHAQRRSISLLGGGLGRVPSHQRFWDLGQLGVNGAHFWIALTPFSIFRVRLARAGSALLRYWRVCGGAPAANAFGSIWVWLEPFSE